MWGRGRLYWCWLRGGGGGCICSLCIQQLQQMFPDRQIVGVQTREVAFGGGNIHCITQQQPAVKK